MDEIGSQFAGRDQHSRHLPRAHRRGIHQTRSVATGLSHLGRRRAILIAVVVMIVAIIAVWSKYITDMYLLMTQLKDSHCSFDDLAKKIRGGRKLTKRYLMKLEKDRLIRKDGERYYLTTKGMKWL